MSELELCPFCKSSIDMAGNPIDLGKSGSVIKCHECGAQGPVHYPGEVFGDVFALWNARAAITKATPEDRSPIPPSASHSQGGE